MDDLITHATSGDERRRAPAVAVLPVGSFEQHGEHLPLITDTLIACLVARRIADDHGLFLLPPITMSCSHEHAQMAGTVSVSASTLYAMVGVGIADEDHSAPDRPHLLTLGMAGYTANGIIGQPSLATAAKGQALLDSFSESARAHLALISAV
ncbi:creatininase family protein [Streptomyces sp. PT12]|uniref:creatininase family protein n=1 Tax=Streptomyces sp. PT12 TaxID=1510197 RepID=UPI000DE34CD1|nr:creatininase family protein [Streptomyces sp. PT12]RBM23588.1 hypothetical protein DEH69_02465 [Streptomyces sp. PT12]